MNRSALATLFSSISIRHLIPLLLLSAGLVLAVLFALIAVPKLERDSDQLAGDVMMWALEDQRRRVEAIVAGGMEDQESLKAALAPDQPMITWVYLTYSRIPDGESGVDAAWPILTAGDITDRDRSLIDIKKARTDGAIYAERIIEDYVTNRIDSITDIGYAALASPDTVSSMILVVGVDREVMRSMVRDASNYPSQLIAIMVLLTAITIVVILNRRLKNRSQPILDIVKAMDRGELASAGALSGEDEFAEIARALERFNSNLTLEQASLANKLATIERESKRKSSYLRNLSRSIRNPLTSAIGHLDAIVERDTLSKQASADLSGALSALQKISHFSNDILEVAVGQSSPYRRSQTAFCVNMLLQEVIDLHGSIISLSGNHLEIHANSSQPVWCYMDGTSARLALNLILQQLFRGAYRQHFRIDLTIDEDPGSEMVRCEIKITQSCMDTSNEKPAAPGQPSKNRPSDDRNMPPRNPALLGILGHKEKTQKDKGLKMINAMIQNIGAKAFERLGDDDSLELGFYFEARKAPQVESFELMMFEEKWKRTLSVLIVESDLRVGHVIETAINSWGHIAKLVTTGQQAIDCVRDRVIAGEPGFDMIIIDNEARDMPGEEILRGIAAYDERQRHIPTIATSIDPSVDAGALIVTGFNDFLPKPFKLKELREKMKQLA